MPVAPPPEPTLVTESTPPSVRGAHGMPPAPYDALVARIPAVIDVHGTNLLNARLLNKDLAFSAEERLAFQLQGVLPSAVLTIEQQCRLELEHLRRKSDDLERYIGLAALQDRNATLFYYLLIHNLEEFLPIVYTPVVGRACQNFSHIFRRTRGMWITPADVDRVPEILRNSVYKDVRLIVVTDNERILGLGDQGAGGMGISLGKLTLYTAGSGIHPSVTLPISLDVGTDNQALLYDPLYIGYRQRRLRGREYDAVVEAFVRGVQEVWPGCLIQWEDFKQQNALRILDRYRDRVPCFNDDIQGTAAVVVAGVLAAARKLGVALRDQRIVLAGAGAAGIGICRLLRLAMLDEGASEADVERAIVLLDSKGLVHAARPDIDESKRKVALSKENAAAYGLPAKVPPPDLLDTVKSVRPTVLVGTTGTAGTFTESAVRAIAANTDRPVIMPLSNPTSNTEAFPADILAWTDGRAMVATGSPFPAVVHNGVRHEIAQANNSFVFPGVGLGAIVTAARSVSDRMFLVAARTLAAEVTDERLATGALFPSVSAMRPISRKIAVAVAREAVESGLARVPSDVDCEALVDAAIWEPEYVPYISDEGVRLPQHE